MSSRTKAFHFVPLHYYFFFISFSVLCGLTTHTLMTDKLLWAFSFFQAYFGEQSFFSAFELLGWSTNGMFQALGPQG
jgi:hypothetical protein